MKELLDREYARFAREGVSQEHPNPLLIAKERKDEKSALLCALFAYGNARAIVKFLQSLDFGLLEADDKTILAQSSYYRFQNPKDVANIFLTLKRADDLESVFLRGYLKSRSVIEGLGELIAYLRSLNPYSSYGYDFLLGKVPPKGKTAGVSPYKRWNMYLRWMVRDADVDLGLWKGVDKADLIVPLDTHTFGVGQRLGLLRRKTCDLQAALELTQSLKKFDPEDPIRYDFALYRLGQRNLV